MTDDGRFLLVAGASGAYVLDAARAEEGAVHPVLGALSITDQLARGPIEVAISTDDRFAFVSIEYSDEIAVFNLDAALTRGFRRSTLTGTMTLGHGVVGLAISPDGRWLYATSEVAAPGPDSTNQGTLSAISVHRAETDPRHAVVATVSAGCQPVRVATSPDGKTIWVTARGSNSLLAFSRDQLLRRSRRALVASVRVGQAPVGVAVVNNGERIVVADSNRFQTPGSSATLSIVDAAAALAHQPALLGGCVCVVCV